MGCTMVGSFKGGVGKTTLVLLIANILAYVFKKKVLIVDLDPSGIATKFHRVKLADVKKKNVLNAIETKDIKKNIIKVGDNIDLLPATINLANFESKFATVVGKELLLKSILKKATGYDEIIIDSQPALTIVTRNAMFAANTVVVAVDFDDWAFHGSKSLIMNIEDYRESVLKSEIDINKIFVLPVRFPKIAISATDRKLKKMFADAFKGRHILPALHSYDFKKEHLDGEMRDGKGYYRDYTKVVREIYGIKTH